MIGSCRLTIALAATLFACARSHENSALDIRGPSSSGFGQAEADAGVREGSGSSIDRGDGGTLANAPPSTWQIGADSGAPAVDAGTPLQADRVHPSVLDDPSSDGREVFVGQLWTIQQSQVLCLPDMLHWADSAIDPMGHVETTVLILEDVDGPALGGRIRFGEGEPPGDPGEQPFSNVDNGSYWGCSRQVPTPGVEYTLRDARRYSDRLTFSIFPGEVWEPWCAKQTSPCGDRQCTYDRICQCTTDGCRALTPEASRHEWVLRLDFNLAVTADTIEGQLPVQGGFGTPADLRLQRQR